MGKCLVTKLKASANNTELPRLGEVRFSVSTISNPTKDSQTFSVNALEPITLEIIGDGFFTDNTLTNNKGKKLSVPANVNTDVTVSNSDVSISIISKYNLVIFNSKDSCIQTDLKDFAYSSNMDILFLTNVSGSLSDMKTLPKCSRLSFTSNYLTGNFKDLNSLQNLVFLYLQTKNISGGIKDIPNLQNLQYLSINVPQTVEDIKAIGNLSSISVILLRGNNDTSSNIPISVLSNITLTDISIRDSIFEGDVATLPALCKRLSLSFTTPGLLTWGSRPSSSNIVALNLIAEMSNIDKMLQDQAQCQVGFLPQDSDSYKKISVVGTRTSASDSAVATLQSKGYTVSITPAS